MDIGTEREIVVVEPVEDPFVEPAPEEPPVREPDPDPEPVPAIRNRTAASP